MARQLFQDDVVKSRVNSLSIAWLANSLAYSIVYPFIPLYLHSERGFPMEKVGLIFPLMGAGIMIGPAISGWLVDHFGRRLVLYIGSTGRGAVFVALAIMALLAAPFWTFAALLFLSSCVGMFFQNASDAYLIDITAPEKRPMAYSKIRVGTNIGWALGPMVGAFLARTPFSLLFALTAVICLACGEFVRATCPETLKRPTASRIAIERNQDSVLRTLSGDRRFLFLVFCVFLLFCLVSQMYSTFSVYATSTLGVSKNMLGVIYSINGLTIVFAQIPVNRLLLNSSLFGRLVLGSVVYCVGYYSFAFETAAAALMVSMALVTFGEIIIHPALYAAASQMAPARAVGRYMGVLGLTRGLGYSIGPYVGALLFARISDAPALMWGLLTLFGVAAAGGFFLLTPRRYADDCSI